MAEPRIRGRRYIGGDWIPASQIEEASPPPAPGAPLPSAPDPDSWLARNPDRKPGDLRITVGILALGALVTLLVLVGALDILGDLLDAW